jgi:hypothetical protein
MFKVSVWAKDGEFGVRPVGSVEEAIAFLTKWPIVMRTPLYYLAAKSIEAAKAGEIPPDEARAALIEFLDDADALAEEQLGP